MSRTVFTTTGGEGKNGIVVALNNGRGTFTKKTDGAGPILGTDLIQDQITPAYRPYETLVTTEVGSIDPLIHIDASNPTGLFANPFNTNPFISGSPLNGRVGAACFNVSTNDLYGFASTSGASPTRVGNDINGLSTMNFDGGSQMLIANIANPFRNYTAGHCFVVAKSTDWTNSNAGASICGASDAHSTARFISFGADDVTGVARIRQRNNDTQSTIDGNTVLGTDARLIEYISDGSTYSIKVDGVAQTLTETAGTNNGDWFADTGVATGIKTQVLDSFTVGGIQQTTVNELALMRLGELRLYGSLTTSQASTIRQELATKWGITLG